MSVTFAGPDPVALTAGAQHHVSTAAIVATRATTFLRAQAQWLRRGLEHADDPVALGIVLAAHDRSHDRWVAHVHAVETSLGHEAAQAVSAVYAHLGRIAGCLEAGTSNLIAAELAVQSRQVVADRLTEATEAAVETLWHAAATD